MNRQTYCTRLIHQSPFDSLSNPPGRIGRKFISAAVLILLHRFHQTGIPFLNQVKEGKTSISILFSDRNDQSKISTGKLPLGFFIFLKQLLDLINMLRFSLPSNLLRLELRPILRIHAPGLQYSTQPNWVG